MWKTNFPTSWLTQQSVWQSAMHSYGYGSHVPTILITLKQQCNVSWQEARFFFTIMGHGPTHQPNRHGLLDMIRQMAKNGKVQSTRTSLFLKCSGPELSNRCFLLAISPARKCSATTAKPLDTRAAWIGLIAPIPY